jgi:hypothetical protein
MGRKYCLKPQDSYSVKYSASFLRNVFTLNQTRTSKLHLRFPLQAVCFETYAGFAVLRAPLSVPFPSLTFHPQYRENFVYDFFMMRGLHRNNK